MGNTSNYKNEQHDLLRASIYSKLVNKMRDITYVTLIKLQIKQWNIGIFELICTWNESYSRASGF